ncbi:hypothetical protein PoB_003755100 [Plakobranchus ocellatus]|uniref:Uncharacterized protein n=1 Tax=Plakobranchus ocellatus TaxID=259542 RepID=A0AAV4AS98_9GAST|nr:hypothetical protein PoB_003755100 [Plakobranchus ocellatus]
MRACSPSWRSQAFGFQQKTALGMKRVQTGVLWLKVFAGFEASCANYRASTMPRFLITILITTDPGRFLMTSGRLPNKRPGVLPDTNISGWIFTFHRFVAGKVYNDVTIQVYNKFTLKSPITIFKLHANFKGQRSVHISL